MGNGLKQGIRVPATMGTKRIPLPVVSNVEGSHIQSPARPRRIDVTAELAPVGSGGGPPFTVDISKYLGLHGAEPPFTINMIGYREYTYSALQRYWTEEDPVVTMDEHGIITYYPSGTYLRNRLEIDFEIGDNQEPSSFRGRGLGELYGNEDAAEFGGIRPIQPSDTVVEDGEGGFEPVTFDGNGETGTLTVQMINDIIGDPEAAARFWAAQGQYDGTCVLASAAGILQALGETLPNGEAATLENLRAYTEQTLDLTGLPVEDQQRIAAQLVRGIGSAADSGGVLGELPAILDPNGQPMYINITYTDHNGNVVTVSDIHPDISRTDGSWANSTVIFDTLGVEHYTGYAADFSTAVLTLESGQGMLLSVDGYELWENNGALIEEAQINFDNVNSSETRQNHAVWLTGIGPNEDGTLGVYLNDSVDLEGGTWYPLDTFLSAWEDAEFAYVGVGAETAPDAGIQQQYQDLQSKIDDSFPTWIGSDLPQKFRNEYVNLKPQTLATEYAYLIPTIEENHPGFTEDLNMYLDDLSTQRTEVLGRYDIDEDAVKAITDHVDTE